MKQHFSIAGLFEKFYLVKEIVRMRDEYPYIFRDGVVVSSFYGCNGSRLNGGRNSETVYPYSEDEISTFCKEHGITPIIVMSNLFTSKNDVDDKAEKIIKTFDHNSTMYVVAGKGIGDWLEHDCQIGRGQFILSTTTCNDAQQTIDETDRYKRIVLAEEFVNNWSTLRGMPERTRNKLEIIVNSSCPCVCSMRKKHYEHISNVNLTGKPTEKGFACINETYCGKGRLFEIVNASQFVSLEMMSTYLDLGINHFKISGRTNCDYDFIETLAYYLIKPYYQMMFREVLMEVAVLNHVIKNRHKSILNYD